MNDIGKPEKADSLGAFGWSLAQPGSDAARRLSDQAEAVTKAMTDWNREFTSFVSYRMNRTSEAAGRMTKCKSLPEIWAIQAQWVQDAVDDYRKEANRLLEVNSKVMRTLP
jgi:hypothetical protein